MIDKVRRYIFENELIEKNDTLVMGISGGADSICLLCVLGRLKEELDINLIAVHINHGLRATALRDQDFTEDMCKRLGIECRSLQVNVKEYASENHISTEEAGRILRYEAFAKVGKEICDNYKIAVAHNIDDNAETLFLNMIRGTGLKGLTGIVPKRDNIIRPLLCVTREEIEQYLKNNNTEFCTDETNLTNDYSRNKIRHNIIPVCKEINGAALERLNSLSNQVLKAEDYLEAETNKVISLIAKEEGSDILIDIVSINKIHEYIKSRALLELLGKAAGRKKDIGQGHINLLNELIDNQVGKSLSLPYGVVAIREYNSIRLTKGIKTDSYTDFNEEVVIDGHTDFMGEGKLYTELVMYNNISFNDIPVGVYEKWFDYDKLENEINANGCTLQLRLRKEKDSICINSAGSRKKLKNYMVDEKIPSAHRDVIPLVSIGSDIVWVVGYRDSSSFRIDSNTKRVLKIRYE